MHPPSMLRQGCTGALVHHVQRSLGQAGGTLNATLTLRWEKFHWSSGAQAHQCNVQSGGQAGH